MTFESAPGLAMSGPELCARLKDPSKTGGRDLATMLDHVDFDTDVNWAFAPGNRPNGDPRSAPPVSHEDFVHAFKEWVAGGAACLLNNCQARLIRHSPTDARQLSDNRGG